MKLVRSELRQWWLLLISMRFAVATLVMVGIAASIGTVLKQNEPFAGYQIAFGPLWFQLFDLLGLYDVYHASWFLLALGLMLASTLFCVIRNFPWMLKTERKSRLKRRTQAVLALRFQRQHSDSLDQLAAKLKADGWKLERDAQRLVASRSRYRHYAYLAAHIGLVVVCLGGLLDGDLWLRYQIASGQKKAETRDLTTAEVPASAWLESSNPSFRAQLNLPEQGHSDVAFLSYRDGFFVQRLPFSVKLERFALEYYPSGQPKNFESTITLSDPDSGHTLRHQLKVNQPVTFKGITLYQSSFGDGGTALKLELRSLAEPQQRMALNTAVHNKTPFKLAGQTWTLEATDFRAMDLRPSGERPNAGARALLGSAASTETKMENLGPNLSYRLRDAKGEAAEYQQYFSPQNLNQRLYRLVGMRQNQGDEFRYLRLPLDATGSVEAFFKLKQALSERPQQWVQLFVRQQNPHPALSDSLSQSTLQLLQHFNSGGFARLAETIDQRVPAAERDKAAELYLKVLLQLGHSAAQQLGLAVDQAFISDTLNAINDLHLWPAPLWLEWHSFEPLASSGLQLTKSPGQFWVYLGAALLTLGVALLAYVRPQRLFVLEQHSHRLVAFETNHNHSGAERLWEGIEQRLWAEDEKTA